MGIGAERGDEVWRCGGVKVLGLGDVVKELTIDKLFRQEPNMTTLLIVDHVLMRVSVGREARRGGEEVFEGADINCRVKYRDRERSG